MKIIPVVLFAGAAAFVSTSNLRDARADAAFKVPVVTIHAKEFAYDLPKTIASGLTTFRLVNDGKELHHASIIKLDKGKTFQDVQAAMKSGGPPPGWMHPVGGPNAALPAGTVEATLDLAPGSYIIVCFITSPGEQMPHMSKGMVGSFTVVAAGAGVAQAGAESAPTPTPDVHLELKDYGFSFSKPVTAGKHTIHVMNKGPQDHEAILIQLAPGKHLKDFIDWATTGGMKGPPPARPIAGISSMAKGRTAIVTDDFTPGTYALTCFVSAPDHKVHAEHGMNLEFEVK